MINNHEQAYRILSSVNYFRLQEYLVKSDTNASFENCWACYQFDTSLRSLVGEAIGIIEIAFRAAVINGTCLNLGPLWYINKEHFKESRPFLLLMRNVNKVIKEQRCHGYDYPGYPPIWELIENLSFGVLSKTFNNLKKISTRKDICKFLGYPPTLIESWLNSLAYVRNLCAHHSRLWNRWLVKPPIIPKNEPYYEYFSSNNNYKLIMIFYILVRLLEPLNQASPLLNKLAQLLKQYPTLPIAQMGFGEYWEDHPLWFVQLEEANPSPILDNIV